MSPTEKVCCRRCYISLVLQPFERGNWYGYFGELIQMQNLQAADLQASKTYYILERKLQEGNPFVQSTYWTSKYFITLSSDPVRGCTFIRASLCFITSSSAALEVTVLSCCLTAGWPKPAFNFRYVVLLNLFSQVNSAKRSQNNGELYNFSIMGGCSIQKYFSSALIHRVSDRFLRESWNSLGWNEFQKVFSPTSQIWTLSHFQKEF